jgi:hypothetical protein
MFFRQDQREQHASNASERLSLEHYFAARLRLPIARITVAR